MPTPILPSVQAPAWWQLLRWIADPLGCQDDYRRRHGDIFRMRLSGVGPGLVLGDPGAIQDLFAQEARFDSGRGNRLAEPLVGSHSLLLMDGARHRRERRLLMPPFHGERLQGHADRIVAISDRIIATLEPGERFVARTLMQRISLEVILRVIFGLEENDPAREGELRSALGEWIDNTGSPLRSSLLFLPALQRDWGPWSPWGRMRRGQRRIHSLLQGLIDRRRGRDGPTGSDVLSLLMAVRDEEGNPLGDEELRDELLTLLFAGHETTATSLAWALYEMHRHPPVLARLQAELAELGEEAAPMEIDRLPYLTALCQEVLRLYPVIPVLFPRIAREPVTIAGHRHPPETTFLASPYLVHRRQDLYPEPRRFRPERFLERQYSSKEYLPFGGGRRRCLGYAFAQLEMKLVLARMINGLRLALVDERPVPIRRRGFTLAPAGGVAMVVRGRSSPHGGGSVAAIERSISTSPP